MDYYGMTCPFAEYIVRNVVGEALMKDPTLAGSLLRLHFHDCFVQGCDASVLLDSTDDNTAEKDALANKSLRGFEVIDRIKEALEAQCPGVVSCADVLALAARDAVFMARGPYYPVPLARRDGTRSVDSDTFLALPPPIKNVTLLIEIFKNVDLDVHDMFKARLQAETETLDGSLVKSLGSVCKGGDSGTAPFDRTSTRFDGLYYRELTSRRGLLSSDQTLFESPLTKEIVSMFAMNPDYFFYSFMQGMHKMGQINLKEGDEGEIRKACRVINS
ncbi:peroxidase 47-like [Panicum miliaceum]|uniref:Peroxidase 1 n=1 Tax=Panicum miliaceum TaxID=4540 RepID=A0A3L6RND2_PANMI|nr:peroxidase 47-like [Panicum miliaceum]